MHRQPTLDKLYGMRLGTMAGAWLEQQGQSAAMELSFDERLGLLVDAEHLARENRALERRLRAAKLRQSDACLENVQTGAKRGLEKSFLLELGTCRWLENNLNMIITGPTGVGKSYLACALGQKACREGYRVVYKRVSRLFDELKLAHAAGEMPRLLNRLMRIDLLILDDWGIGALTEQQRHDVLEILEDRYAKSSTLVTSQLPIKQWHDHIGDPTIADAVLDRIVHNAHKLQLKGASRRKENAKA